MRWEKETLTLVKATSYTENCEGDFNAVEIKGMTSHLDLSVLVDVAVLALDESVRVARLQLEGTVGGLVAVRVGAVLIVPTRKLTIEKPTKLSSLFVEELIWQPFLRSFQRSD